MMKEQRDELISKVCFYITWNKVLSSQSLAEIMPDTFFLLFHPQSMQITIFKSPVALAQLKPVAKPKSSVEIPYHIL